MTRRFLGCAVLAALLAAAPCAGGPVIAQADVAGAVEVMVAGVPRIASAPKDIPLAHGVAAKLGFISSIAVDESSGLTYLLHRGPDADPVLVVDRRGALVRSWGKGLFKTPHSIRLDAQGNVWTVDSVSSTILKFSPAGEKLLAIEVGGQPDPTKTTGTADIAFGPNGQLFIADGYGNARILEFDASGKKVREWGTHGTRPGHFNVPHALVVASGAIFVADRENGRVQKFDLMGKFLAEWPGLVKPMSLAFAKDGSLLVAIGYRDATNKQRPWLAWVARLDTASGKVIQALEVGDDAHGFAVTGGAILTGGTTGALAAVHAFPVN